jgi:hypothetical protein
MTAGVYVFRLTITDNKGNKATDDAVITVTGSTQTSVTTGIYADAGKDETIPVGQATVLRGFSKASSGGYITKYLWTKVSGPVQYQMLTPNEPTTWIRYMTAGTYVYRVTITDNTGATASDDVVITVTAVSAMNRGATGPLAEQQAAGGQMGQETLELFPNPVSSQANIKWSSSYYGAATIKVIDATDVAISTVTIRKDQHQYLTNLDLGSLKPGVYILEVRMQNGKLLTKKFIKQ